MSHVTIIFTSCRMSLSPICRMSNLRKGHVPVGGYVVWKSVPTAVGAVAVMSRHGYIKKREKREEGLSNHPKRGL